MAPCEKITGVAVEYANLDAWEVAEGVYADLASSDLKIRRPERLEFARGLCQLGRAMPDHAREILTALNAAGLGEEERNEPSEEAIAAGGPLGMMGNMVGEGEFGGARGARWRHGRRSRRRWPWRERVDCGWGGDWPSRRRQRRPGL